MNQIIDHNNSTKNAKYLYLKYKSKYLNLKKKIEIYGGGPDDLEQKLKKDYEEIMDIHVKHKESAKKYKLKLKDIKQKNTLYRIFITQKLNDDNKAINNENEILIKEFKSGISSEVSNEKIEQKIKTKIEQKMMKTRHVDDEKIINDYIKKIIKINELNKLLNYNIERYIQMKRFSGNIKDEMDRIKSTIEKNISENHEQIKTKKIELHNLIKKKRDKKLEEKIKKDSGNPDSNVTSAHEESTSEDTQIKIGLDTIQDTLKVSLESDHKSYDENIKKYKKTLEDLNTGINKINELYNSCLNENIELYKLSSNDIIDLQIKHGKPNQINCFNIPNINKSLKEMEDEHTLNMTNLNFLIVDPPTQSKSNT